MRRPLVVVLLLAVAGAVGSWVWSRAHRPKESGQLTLYGNVDLRQVNLAFNNNERITAVLFQEGDRVKRGQVMARLDTSRLEPQVAQAQAQVDAQKQVVLRLHNGSRPEEIAQAKANVESAKADAAGARLRYERLKALYESSGGKSVTLQDMDDAKTLLDARNAKVVAYQEALDLAIAGPRAEDIAQAEAQLLADEARLKFLQQQLADMQIFAPTDAIVRSRLLEPGDMASPAKPVYSLAIVDPKWVRAYVSEPDLGKVYPGSAASVIGDAFPDRPFKGWVGFISPEAEFTPKTVQTQELRTSLVYEVRVFVNDPQNDLRLGMPATVYLPLTQDHRGATTQPSAPVAATSPAK